MEINSGNELEKAVTELQYTKNLKIKEYINIYKLIRIGLLHDFVEFFNNFEKNIEQSNTESKIAINDYINAIYKKKK